MKKVFILAVSLLAFSSVSGQKMRILINHLGYDPAGVKTAVIQGYENDSAGDFAVYDYTDDRKVYSGTAEKAGPVDAWKNWIFWTLDFTGLEEGEYYIVCRTGDGSVQSFPFLVQKNILERHTLSDVIFYFRGQRLTGPMNKADSRMIFADGRPDTVDVRGGWHDASGDYGKHLTHLSYSTYFNPQQIPLVTYNLAKTLEILEDRGDVHFNQLKRRLVDELLFGADYLVRMRGGKGSFYRSVSAGGPGKLPKDRIIGPAIHQTDIYEVGYRSGGGIAIASLAMAARLDIAGEFSSEEYLQTAEGAFDYLEKHNLSLTNDGKENIVDDYCALAAATELYRVTKNAKYKKAADARAQNLMNRFVSWKNYENYLAADDKDRPFFHAADEGYPAVSLLYYSEICDEKAKPAVLEAVRKIMNYHLTITDEVTNPFGYARQLVQRLDGKRYSAFFFPHQTETRHWWQGENARLGSLAAAARLAALVFDSDQAFVFKLRAYAQDQLNWILGLNPFDVCMLAGTGRNNPEYMFYGSWQYTSAPGGIVNGITGGLENERDIDFNIPFEQTGQDHDWRWCEQWLPHAAWYMLAAAVEK